MNSWTSWLRLQSCVSSSVCVCRRGTGWWWWARWTRRLSPSRPAAQSTSQLEIFSWNVLLNYLWVNPSKYLTGPLMKIAAAVSNSSLQCVFLQIRTKLWISWDWLNQLNRNTASTIDHQSSLPSSTGSTAGLPKVNSSMLVTSLQELWQENYLMIIVAAICWHSPLSTEARVGGGWHSGLRQQRIFTSQTDRVVLTEARWDCTMTTLTPLTQVTTGDTEQCPDQRHEALSSSSDFSENLDFMFSLPFITIRITKSHILYGYVI